MAIAVFFTSVLLFLAWLALVFIEWKLTSQRESSALVMKALALWPLLLVDTIIRLTGFSDGFAIAGIVKFLPVVLLLLLTQHWAKAMQPKMPLSVTANILIVCCAVACELPLLIQPVNYNNWVSITPTVVSQFWAVYLCYTVSAGLTLLMGLRLYMISASYHQHLSWQAVDIQRYQRPQVTLLAASIMGLALLSFTLVLGLALGLATLPFWPLIIDLILAFCVLCSLVLSIVALPPLSSPLNIAHIVAAGLNATPQDKKLVKTAEATMVKHKVYKSIGYTIEEFAMLCRCTPYELAVALRRVNKQDFRGFIFHYRMEYARNIVMRSDASIAAVAKRLGFHSEKFLSGPFLSYLEKRS